MSWVWWDDFDRRMCGKWKSEEMQISGYKETIFLNIEFENDETGVKVMLGFGSEDCNTSAFYVESSYNSLYFFHNDREHRAEYILTFYNDNDGWMLCKYSVRNCYGLSNGNSFAKEIAFTRISAPLSEEEIKKYKVMNRVALKDAAKIDILKEYAEYGDIKSDVKFEYKFDERENMLDIIEKYNLDDLVKNKNDIDTAIALMHWFCGRYRHGNPSGGGLASIRTPQALMKYADEHEGRTNCRGLSLILAQLIRAYNIKAFHVTCMPYEQPFDDCHVVVCVYCGSLEKYIMLDPSANLYLKNKAGNIIGVEEFRDILISDGELFHNEEATNWGNEGTMTNLDSYRDYMAKNLIRIERFNINSYGNDGNCGGGVILIPEKYMQNEAKNYDDSNREDFITSREYFWRI